MNQRPGGENLHIPLQIPGDAQGLSSPSALLLIYYYLSMIVAIARAGITAWAVVSCRMASRASPSPSKARGWDPGAGVDKVSLLAAGKTHWSFCGSKHKHKHHSG